MSASQTVIRASQFTGSFAAFSAEQLSTMMVRLYSALKRTSLTTPHDPAGLQSVRNAASETYFRLCTAFQRRDPVAFDKIWKSL